VWFVRVEVEEWERTVEWIQLNFTVELDSTLRSHSCRLPSLETRAASGRRLDIQEPSTSLQTSTDVKFAGQVARPEGHSVEQRPLQLVSLLHMPLRKELLMVASTMDMSLMTTRRWRR